MFGLTKYIDKIFEVKWYFDDNSLQDLESLLFCKFTKDTEQKCYMLNEIQYTYVDVLLGLEELNFTFEKCNDNYLLKIKS